MKIGSRDGDTLWYYSQLFNIPLHIMEDSNKLLIESKDITDQSVHIPGYEVSTITSQNNSHSFFDYAKKHFLAADALFLVNSNKGKRDLNKIVVPKKNATPIISSRKQYSYDVLVRDMQQLRTIFPFMDIDIIGESVEERLIYEIKIGRGSKKVHINGSFHANEWITTSVIMKFVNDYLISLTTEEPLKGIDTRALYDQVTLSIVPMVNPDGVDLVINGPDQKSPFYEELLTMNKGSHDFSQWKANIRGVDLNDQFPADWEIEAKRKPQTPSSRDFPGFKPLSEPESQAMARLTKKSDFSRVVAIHTQGQEIYWGYEGYEPDYAEVIVNEFTRVSGYKAVQYLDSYAGYKDWFIQDFRRPGYTVELGIGQNPLPLSQFEEIYHDSLGIFLASLYM